MAARLSVIDQALNWAHAHAPGAVAGAVALAVFFALLAELGRSGTTDYDHHHRDRGGL